MATVTLEEAQARLANLLEAMQPGETLQLTKDNQTVARLVKEVPPSKEPRQPGSAIGKLVILVEDDEHLEHFKDYMP